jgi:hypothetical protein
MGNQRALIGTLEMIKMVKAGPRFMSHRNGVVNLGEIDYLQEKTKKHAGNKKATYITGYTGRPGSRKITYDFGPCRLEDVVAYINGRRVHKSKRTSPRFDMVTEDVVDDTAIFCIIECEVGRFAVNLSRISYTKPRNNNNDDDDDDEEEDDDDEYGGSTKSKTKAAEKYVVYFKSNAQLVMIKKELSQLTRQLNIVDRSD